MNRDKIREIFLKNGFTVKEGQTDLKEYVYQAAEELLAEAVAEATTRQVLVKSASQASAPAKRRCGDPHR